jgi:hypothetical protein
VEREVRQQTVRASGLNGENTEKKEIPAWQVRIEEEMARLDREAELNREREARLQPTKVFKPSAFGEERGLSAALELRPKRVVFPIAGKGGVGKTTVMATLVEWYASTAYTADLFDMDPDDKTEGCFKALFAKAHKLPALESWTYDKLLGISMESSADVILADLGAAQGHRMIPWFRDFYKVMQDSGLDLRWTAQRKLNHPMSVLAKSGMSGSGIKSRAKTIGVSRPSSRWQRRFSV